MGCGCASVSPGKEKAAPSRCHLRGSPGSSASSRAAPTGIRAISALLSPRLVLPGIRAGETAPGDYRERRPLLSARAGTESAAFIPRDKPNPSRGARPGGFLGTEANGMELLSPVWDSSQSCLDIPQCFLG